MSEGGWQRKFEDHIPLKPVSYGTSLSKLPLCRKRKPDRQAAIEVLMLVSRAAQR